MYYGFKLRPDDTLLYEIKHDLATHGRQQGKQSFGRLYHLSPSPGVNAPITFEFISYEELGVAEFLSDLPRIAWYAFEWQLTRLWARASAKVQGYYKSKRF